MEEHRHSIRINKQITISYEILGDFLGASCPSSDISEGGLRIAVYQRLDPKMILKLWIRIEESAEPIIAIGEVVWLHSRDNSRYPYEIGIKFTRISEQGKSKLYNYIRKISGQGSSGRISWAE